jgi:hypothetical protein
VRASSPRPIIGRSTHARRHVRRCIRSAAVTDWQAVRDRRLQFAREAVELVAADVGAGTRLPPPSSGFRIEEDGAIRVAYWGQFATMTLMGVTREELLVEVADFMQDEVIEDLHSPWPVCHIHDKGGYAQLVDRQPVWYCRFGSHTIAAIGALAR